MPQVEKIKIFLASPSDVAKERRYVEEVIKEINDTVASSKNIVLELVHSGKTYPGYGQDGQAVLNAQIASMEEYALFVGIIWNRIGTPTPRAESGTVEEFERAVTAFKSKAQPQIWFYFRQSAAQLNTEEELEQRRKVLDFKKKVQRNALTHEYKNPSNFRDQFRQDILRWLNKLPNKTSRPRIVAANQNKKSSILPPTNSQLPTTEADKQRKSSSTSTAKKRPPAGSRLKNPTTRNISNSGAWVMLNDNFFLTESVDTQANQAVTLHISPANPEQEVALRNLQPHQYYKKQIAYAYQNEAATMQVESVTFKSIKGKNLFILTLIPERRSQGISIMEVNINGYSADQIAELRARLLLLNEPPSIQSKNNSSLIDSWVQGYDNTVKVEKSIFPDLWTRLKTKPPLFLAQARLAAVYHLKMSHTVEHILELKLGLIKGNVMSVQFRGERKSFSINQEPVIIQFQGTCLLEGFTYI